MITAQQPDTPVLRIRSLSKTYGSGETAEHALRDVDSVVVPASSWHCWAPQVRRP